MDTIEKKISNLIETQFPYFMQEEGPVLVEFVKKYYEWMESQGQAIYHARHLPAYKDIDTTVSQFLVYFKEKYLKNIQFQTEVSTRRMVKHSLDLYRSKGTERAVDLMFKAVFNTPAEVYLPGRDLFKLSSGDYYQQYYLEVTPLPINITFVNKQIVGVETGATAFVEKLVRKKIKNAYNETFVISSLKGHFRTGELLRIQSQRLNKNNPRIVGSLTSVNVLTGSSNYQVGDIVDIASDLGVGAKGRVLDVASATGQVSFKLEDGGFGYTSNPDIYVSEKVLRLSNVQTDATTSSYYFKDFDEITSPQGQINFADASGTFAIGSNVYTYNPGGSEKGRGIIQGILEEGTNSGYLFVSVVSGSLDSDRYYSYGNVISADAGLVPYQDRTATATVIGTSNNVVINYDTASSVLTTFKPKQTIYQLLDNGLRGPEATVVSSTALGRSGSITVVNTTAPFQTNKLIRVDGSDLTANAASISMDVGIILATPTTITRNQVNSISTTTLTVGSTLGIFPGSDVQLVDTSFTLTGVSSSGTTLTVSSSANIIEGSPVTIVSGTGELASNTTVSTILGPTSIQISATPVTPLSGATIRVSPFVGNTQGVLLNVNSVVNSSAVIINQAPSIAFTNATVAFIPPDLQFYSNTGNYIYTSPAYTNASVYAVSTGALANFSVTQALSFPETIELNTDLISDYASVFLDATDYGFGTTYTSNLSSTIADVLHYDTITIGKINEITGVNGGYDYNFAPVVRIKEPLIAGYNYVDEQLELSNFSGAFGIGDIIKQPAVSENIMGVVTSVAGSSIIVRRLSFENNFSFTVSNTQIISVGTGATAYVNYVSRKQKSKPMGYNAIVSANVVSVTGSVTAIEVVDSGFGYAHNEIGTFTKDGLGEGSIVMLLGTNNSDEAAQGREGKALGVYRDDNGFLSNNKKVHDGYYYQEFSYEVRSSVTLDKYEAMLKQLLHIAGTKYFAATVRSSTLPVGSRISSMYEFVNMTADKDTITADSSLTTDTTYV